MYILEYYTNTYTYLNDEIIQITYDNHKYTSRLAFNDYNLTMYLLLHVYFLI